MRNKKGGRPMNHRPARVRSVLGLLEWLSNGRFQSLQAQLCLLALSSAVFIVIACLPASLRADEEPAAIEPRTHSSTAPADLPPEPVAIGLRPQYVFDRYIVDNHWPLRAKREYVRRVFHAPQKHPDNPLLHGDQPSFCSVVRDEQAGLYRMYYQANIERDQAEGRGAFRTFIAYAESEDGIRWKKPDLQFFPQLELKPNNIVLARPENPEAQTSAPALLEVPERDRRGYRYLMLYRGKGRGNQAYHGIRIVGSHDGVRWDLANDQPIARLHSDTANTICYDSARNEYVMFCRAKHIYRAFGTTMMDTGASRRIARLASPTLWTDWLQHGRPQNVLVPDELDADRGFTYFYGMPTRYHDGIYWGFLEPFRLNDDIHTELAWSRDGIHFQRLPDRPRLIEYGEEGTWDDTMIFASPSWVEVDDRWYIYYSGWDGPHGTSERQGGIGLATVRKEGLVSLRGPRNGGVVCTRRMLWPGGDLLLNVDAKTLNGDVAVRISDANRRVVPGFDYSDGEPFTGDDVRHRYCWGKRSLDELRGQEIRLEILLRDADLYTFQAAGPAN